MTTPPRGPGKYITPIQSISDVGKSSIVIPPLVGRRPQADAGLVTASHPTIAPQLSGTKPGRPAPKQPSIGPVQQALIDLITKPARPGGK